jgi:hypothetical protein
MMYTGSPLIGQQLTKLAQDFLTFVNALEWKGKLLATRASLLSPTPWLKGKKIGNWIGSEGVERLVARTDENFVKYEYWATNNPICAANFWKPGSWTYENAAFFGAAPGWLSPEGRIRNAKALKEAGNAEESEHELE